MKNPIRFAIAYLLFMVIFCGCSSGNHNPVSTPESDKSQQDTLEDGSVVSGIIYDSDMLPIDQIALTGGTFNSLGVFGVYDFSLSENDLKVELSMSRTAALGESYLISGLNFFTQSPCPDCLKLYSIAPSIEGIVVTFSISHPFEKGNLSEPPKATNRRDLDIFDMAMVIIPSNETPELFSNLNVAAYLDICNNADGFTKEMSGYTVNSTASPFYLVLDSSETQSYPNNRFVMGTKNIRFDTYFKEGGQFELYLTIGYGAAAKKSTFLYPTYYVPEFNKKAAWKVEAIPPEGDDPPSLTNTWAVGDTTTPHTVTVKVYDWQQGATVASSYPDPMHTNYILKASNVSSVSVDIQGMTSYANTVTSSTGGTGGATNPLIFEVPIINSNNLPQGHYPGLVKVLDQRTPSLPGTTDSLMHSPDGIIQNWYSIPEFATYQTFVATVGECPTPEPPATVTASDETYPNRIVITWSDVPEADTFNVYRNGSLRVTGLTAPTWTDMGVTGGTTYLYQVSGSNTCGEGEKSIEESGSTCLAPTMPGNFAATDGTYPTYVHLSWTASTPPPFTYTVYRDGVSLQTGLTGLSYDDYTAQAGMLYLYGVEAVNTCGPSTRATDNGNITGCTLDENETCGTADEIYRIETIAGCTDGIDTDWFYFYMPPKGFTNACTLTFTMTSGTVDVTIYGTDPPATTCPGPQIYSATNVGTQTLTDIPASAMSKVFIKLVGHGGVCNYTMAVNFPPEISSVAVEVFVATTTGELTGTWPTNWTHTAVVNQINWANQFWDDYGYELAWDGTVTPMIADYYTLDDNQEIGEMHTTYRIPDTLSLYIVNDYPGSPDTAFCVTYSNKSYHNINNVFTVYSPSVVTWQNVFAHEHGHAFGYYFDEYLYNEFSCSCGGNVCLCAADPDSCIGGEPYLFWINNGCYNGNLMHYSVIGWPITSYNLQTTQASAAYQFHYEYPNNFEWN